MKPIIRMKDIAGHRAKGVVPIELGRRLLFVFDDAIACIGIEFGWERGDEELVDEDFHLRHCLSDEDAMRRLLELGAIDEADVDAAKQAKADEDRRFEEAQRERRRADFERLRSEFGGGTNG